MIHRMKTGAALVALLTLAACQQSAPTFGGGTSAGPAPLPSAPRGQVFANQLPPPPPPPSAAQAPAGTDGAAGAPGAPGAAPTQTASAGPVTREGLVGAWRVSSAGGNCQIFMALTQWSGGYRAASRGCPGQIADVSAWDVSGNQVVLRSGSGDTVATLNNAGGTRYEGTTTGGQQISLFR